MSSSVNRLQVLLCLVVLVEVIVLPPLSVALRHEAEHDVKVLVLRSHLLNNNYQRY